MWQRDGGTFSDSPSIIHEQLGSRQETGQNLETVRWWGDLLMWDVWLGEIASLHLIFVPLCAWLYRQVRPLTYALHSLRQHYCSGTLTLGQFHGARVKAQMVGPDHSQQSSLLAVEGMLFRCKTESLKLIKSLLERKKKKGWDKEIILSVFLEMDVKVVPFVVIINQQTCNNKKSYFSRHMTLLFCLMSSNRLFWLTMMCAVMEDKEYIRIWEFDILCQENESRCIDYQNWCRLIIRQVSLNSM